VFVIVCQIKINVTNAYAGSIAWSNFFSRLTHSHPGRVVWLVFNVLVALLLMEVGILKVLESILGLYAHLAVAWLGAVAADLTINKPLGFSPPYIEFKRAHLYDINPVGVGSMVLSVLVSVAAFFGAFGLVAQALSPFLGLVVAYVAAPLIAWGTKGRWYIARTPQVLANGATTLRCSICENTFEQPDMAFCPAYDKPICSLCCSIEARCHDMCKKESRFGEQIAHWLQAVLPRGLSTGVHTRIGHFLGVMALFTVVVGGLIIAIDFQFGAFALAERAAVRTALVAVFFSLFILLGVAAWLLVLAQESRRKAEEETARQTAMLMDEIVAHERTDAALQKAKEAAEAANAAKSRYIIGVSHEIRAPLNAISGYAQLLENQSVARPADAVRVIRRSAEHLSNLIDGLLDISKIESGVRKLSRDKVRLGEFLDQHVGMFRIQASAKGLDFVYERPDHMPAYVYTDSKILRQILINLLSNAVKYTEVGQVGLRMRYRSQTAEFEIFDTGIGIQPDEVERIFEPFERGRGQAVRSITGTGLGLTITRLLTRIMGGDISLRSIPGKGSVFRLRMMLSEAPHTAQDDTDPTPITGYLGPRIPVLLVDDTPDHLSLMRDILEPLGFVVFTASDGAAAVELAQTCQPRLVMLDISMPGESGWDVAERLRDVVGTEARIMMVSANAYDKEGPPDERPPVHDAFMAKPVELRPLLDRIGELLALEWIRAASGAADAADNAPISETIPESMRAHLEDLRQLGRIGYIRGIEAKLKEIEVADAACGPFVGHLRAMVRAFNLRGYLKALEPAAGEG
jgi:LSD1 subclass zinc finger protein